MDGDGDTRSRVCKAQDGQYIAFWRGQVVCKLGGALRYFGSEQAAEEFLSRRAAAATSMIGNAAGPRTPRIKASKA